jgi:hypothetical protein
MNELQKVTYSAPGEFTIPEERHMGVRPSDWERLRQNVERLGEPLTDHAITWAATAVGAAIGLLGTNIALKTSGTHPAHGVVPVLWALTACAVIFAVCFGLVSRAERKRRGLSVETVCRDMDGVAKRAGHEGLGVLPPPPPRPGIFVRVWRALFGRGG